MMNDFASWLTPDQEVLIVTRNQTFRGFFKTVCGDFIVLETGLGDQHFIREELIESFTAYQRSMAPVNRGLEETETLLHSGAMSEGLSTTSSTGEEVASSIATGSEEETTESLLSPVSGVIDAAKTYMYKPGDRIPLPSVEDDKPHMKPRTPKSYKADGIKHRPHNSADKPTLGEILDEIEDQEDRSTIPAEDLLTVRASGMIKMRENMKKYGFIEGFDEEKTNYWFPFNALTDENLSVTDEVIFCKGSNDKGHTASGIASPATIHRLLLLVDYILKNRYYNFPIVLPLLEAMLEQHPENKSIQDKYQEVKERQASYSKRKMGLD